VSLDPLSKTCQIWAQWVTAGPPAQQKTGHHCIWWFFLEPAGTSLNGAAHDQLSTRNSAAARGIRKRAVPLPFSSMAYYSYAIIDTNTYTPSARCLTLNACSPTTTTQTHIARSARTEVPQELFHPTTFLTLGFCLS